MNGEIYTWGGFHEMQDAFNQIALIFSDHNYQAIFSVILTLAITGGIARWLMQAVKGGGQSLWALFIPIVIGIAIHRGLIMPTGQLVIYDPVRNETGFVAGVPDGIVLLANAFNSFQRGIVDITDTSGPLDYNTQAGGISFDLMQSAPQTLYLDDQYLNGSLKQYIKDCMLPEIASPTANPPISINDIYNNTDFLAVLKAGANPAIYTVFYQDSTNACPSGNVAGTPTSYQQGCAMQCDQAFASISTAVQAPNAFTKGIANMCSANGFDPTNQTELQQCQTALANTINQLLVNGNTIFTIQNIATQNAVAMALNGMLSSLTPQASTAILATRSAGASMQAVGLEANKWIPTLMAVTFATFIGLIPFLCIFLVTPFSGQVIKLIVGFFFVITCWGVVDATIHTLGMNSALRAMNEISQYGLGYYSMMNFSLASQKAAGLYGQLRLEGFLFSTFIAGAFGFTTMSAFSHFVMGLQGAVSQGASTAAQTATTPAGRGAFEQANATGGAQNELFNDPKFGAAFMNAKKASAMTQTGAAAGAADRLSAAINAGMLPPGSGLQDLGQLENRTATAGTEQGQVNYTTDGKGNIVMGTTATGDSVQFAGGRLQYDQHGNMAAANLDNYTPSLDKSMREAKRDGWSQRVAATSAFQDVAQHGSNHGQRYGTNSETADQLSNNANQQMTQTIAHDRSLQTRLMSSVERSKHAEAGLSIGIPQAITRISGLGGSAGGGLQLSWRDSSGKEYTSRISASDSEAFTTAYNHAVSNSVRTMSSTESGSQNLQNLMRSAGLNNEASELHSIDTEHGLTEGERFNMTAGLIGHVGQEKFGFMATGRGRDEAAASWINSAAKGDNPAEAQELSRLSGDFMRTTANKLRPQDTLGVQKDATTKITAMKTRETAATPALDNAQIIARGAEGKSKQQAQPQPLVKPSEDDSQIKRDARQDEINRGMKDITH